MKHDQRDAACQAEPAKDPGEDGGPKARRFFIQTRETRQMAIISAKVIADSISRAGKRLTTFELVYPRWIHAEGRTHRVFSEDEEWEPPTPSLMAARELSRNASSSRAIPVKRLIEDVLRHPAIPLFWGKNQPGMQAGGEHDQLVWLPSPTDPADPQCSDLHDRHDAWLWARDQAVVAAKAFDAAGYHKQIVNRLIEPFSHIKVVVTATEWDNFYLLRDHPGAEPHIRLLSQRMRAAMDTSEPIELMYGEWHLPYVAVDEQAGLDGDFYKPRSAKSRDIVRGLVPDALKLSVARCARVSYLTHEGLVPRHAEDLALYERLVGSVPLHASPAEHQGTPYESGEWQVPNETGNFHGWRQFRKLIE